MSQDRGGGCGEAPIPMPTNHRRVDRVPLMRSCVWLQAQRVDGWRTRRGPRCQAGRRPVEPASRCLLLAPSTSVGKDG